MGIYRFVLAILVFLSHTGYAIGGYNTGVVSVVSFFLISGYTMQILLQKYYTQEHERKYFYIDRIWRLWPQLFVYLFATLLIIGFTKNEGLKDVWLYHVTIIGIIEQLLILPLGYYMFLECGKGAFLAPQAWTLGLEMTFYLVIPFIKRGG